MNEDDDVKQEIKQLLLLKHPSVKANLAISIIEDVMYSKLNAKFVRLMQKWLAVVND